MHCLLYGYTNKCKFRANTTGLHACTTAHLSITADVKYMDFYIHQNSEYFSNEQVDRQTDRRTDGRTHRKVDSQTDGQTDLRTDRHTDRQTYEQTDLQTDRPTDKQTVGYGPKGRQTD
jgi:hypothetical protein